MIIILLITTNIYSALKAVEYRNHINDFLYKYLYLLDRLSQREIYRDANKHILVEKGDKKRIVFIGTQVTLKWPMNEQLADFECINRGIWGQRFEGVYLRFRQDVISLNPDAVVIEMASYNFRPHIKVYYYRDYLQNMVELSLFHNILPVLTTIITPAPFRKEFDYQNMKDSIYAFNQWIRQYAQKNNLPICDFDGILKGQKGYIALDKAANSVEPNEKGFQLLSDELKRILKVKINECKKRK